MTTRIVSHVQIWSAAEGWLATLNYVIETLPYYEEDSPILATPEAAWQWVQERIASGAYGWVRVPTEATS